MIPAESKTPAANIVKTIATVLDFFAGALSSELLFTEATLLFELNTLSLNE